MIQRKQRKLEITEDAYVEMRAHCKTQGLQMKTFASNTILERLHPPEESRKSKPAKQDKEPEGLWTKAPFWTQDSKS